MSWRYKGGFIQLFFDPLAVGAAISPLYAVGMSAYYGQLGLGDTVDKNSPVQVGTETTWLKVGCMAYGSTAVKSNGTLWTWGGNNAGQLGKGDVIYRSSPTQVGALTNWSTSGGNYQLYGIKTDGTLWMCGSNPKGELGQNDIINRSSPVQVGLLSNWSSITSMPSGTLALKTDGTLWSWGNNSVGQLGDNTVLSRSSPVQIGTQTNWYVVSSNNSSSGFALKTDGTIWSWGYNYSGQLGQNDTINKSSPVQIGALTTWSKILASGDSMFAIKTDGTLWSWGRNDLGQLCQNNKVYRSSPVQIGTQTNWLSFGVTLGATFSAIKTDRTVWVCGDNQYGQLGQGTTGNTTARSSPVQIGAQSDWSSIAGGIKHLLLSKDL